MMSKCERMGNLLSFLSRSTGRPNIKIFTTSYKITIRSIADHRTIVLEGANQTAPKRLEVIQSKFLKSIIRANKSSPTTQLHFELGLEPLKARRVLFGKALIFKTQFRVNTPTNKTIQTLNTSHKNLTLKSDSTSSATRLKNCLNGESKHPIIDPTPPDLSKAPRAEVQFMKITKKEALKDNLRVSLLFQRAIEELDPGTVMAFTDGSIHPTTKHGGVGIYIEELNIMETYKLENPSSICEVELAAVKGACEALVKKGIQKAIIFSDSRSALQAILDYQTRSPLVNDIVKIIKRSHKKGYILKFTWIPSHSGIPQNDIADSLAKKGSIEGKEITLNANLNQKKKEITNEITKKLKPKTNSTKQKKKEKINKITKKLEPKTVATKQKKKEIINEIPNKLKPKTLTAKECLEVVQ